MTTRPRPAQLCLSVLCALCLAVGSMHQGQAADVGQAQVDAVFGRLLSVAEAVPGMAWPPSVEVRDEEGVNAYATVTRGPDGELHPKIVVLRGTLEKVVEGDADRLAFVLGHELAHIVLQHVGAGGEVERTPFVRAVFNREQELAADSKGMQLALAAGYSYRRAQKGISRVMELGLDYSSFEGLGADHPSWKDRCVLLDDEQASLWRAMSAFDNGALFLSVEQYEPAVRCLRRVTKEFPSCYEAWANLGYALLMQYCDALDTDDLGHFGVGQVVCGGFYRRPESLEAQVRGIDEEIWWDAVGALREALRLKPELTLAKANLGVAYLLRPSGPDSAQATRFLQEAAESAARDESLDPLARAAVYVNAGVADLAGGDAVSCAKRLDAAAAENGRALAGHPQRLSPTASVSAALAYNRASLLARSARPEDRERAAAMLAEYLRAVSRSSSWWALAYRQYRQLCQAQGVAAKSEAELIATGGQSLRPITSVRLARGELLTLSEPATEVEELLGPVEAIPVLAGTNLRRLSYASRGVDVLVADSILAISLTGPAAPALAIRGTGLGANTVTLRVGMTREELEETLVDESYDFRQLIDSELNYRFYRAIGLAARVREGRVVELVVVQIPDRVAPGAG